MMRARKIKRICSVRGCRNTDCYVIARFCEFANSVIICKDCLRDALAVINPSVFEFKAAEEPKAENIENVTEPTVETAAAEKSDTKSKENPQKQTKRRASKAKEE